MKIHRQTIALLMAGRSSNTELLAGVHDVCAKPEVPESDE